MVRAVKRTADETANHQARGTLGSPEAPIGQLLDACSNALADLASLTGSSARSAPEQYLLKAIINQVPDLVYAKDRQGRFLAVNDAVLRTHALQDLDELIGKTDFDLFPAAIAQGFFDTEQAIMAGGEPMIDHEVELVDKSGAPKWVQVTKVPMRDSDGAIIGLIGMARNVTLRKNADLKLEAERTLFRAMIDQVPDYLFVKDTESRFVIANRAVAADLGHIPADLIGKTDFDFHNEKFTRKFFGDEQKVVSSGEPLIGIEEMIVDFSGRDKWFSTSKVPLRNDHGQIVGIVGVSRDITDRKHAEDKLHFMALHDALTGLPNRTLLVDRIEQNILEAKRSGGQLTTLFIDLDNFKIVNDSLGHNAGDALLKTVADRMVAATRASDFVARFGGDEFVIVLVNQAAGTGDATGVIAKIVSAVAEPILIEGTEFRVTCSIGVANYPGDGDDASALLTNADIAMYAAKQSDREKIVFFSQGMDKAARERRLLHESLRNAIANDELSLAYQPQVDLKTDRIFAVEALARWTHPVLGPVSPVKFIPLVEESGLIILLGDWALREACRQNKAWQDAGLTPITVCVNVSARQVREPDWVKRVADILFETRLKPQYLELEITESLLMHDVQRSIANMQQLQALGINFAIDDFGTGYSSLSTLASFPATRLKIDRSFIRDLGHDASQRNIATAVISLGHKLNMRVIAEGVETDEQLAFLRENKCDEMQGYLFSRPVGAEAIAGMLSR